MHLINGLIFKFFFKRIINKEMCILDGCNYKEKYGEYCYKHRRNYLIDSSNPSKNIIVDRWTGKCYSYLKQDIIDNLRDLGIQ